MQQRKGQVITSELDYVLSNRFSATTNIIQAPPQAQLDHLALITSTYLPHYDVSRDNKTIQIHVTVLCDCHHSCCCFIIILFIILFKSHA